MADTLFEGEFTYDQITIGEYSYNVYADLAYAMRYQAARPYNKAWVDASPEERQRALVMGTDVVDSSFIWKGSRVELNQPLDFPRNGLFFDENGNSLDTLEIPDDIKRASAEQAFEILRDGDIVSAENARGSSSGSITTTGTLDKIKVGSIELDYGQSTTSKSSTNTANDNLLITGSYLSQYVTNLVQQFVDEVLTVNSLIPDPTKPEVNIVRLVRA